MGKVIYFKHDIMQKAGECSTRCEFREKHEGYYNAARRMKILDEVCNHMPRNMNFKYDIVTIKQESQKYITKSDFF